MVVGGLVLITACLASMLATQVHCSCKCDCLSPVLYQNHQMYLPYPHFHQHIQNQAHQFQNYDHQFPNHEHQIQSHDHQFETGFEPNHNEMIQYLLQQKLWYGGRNAGAEHQQPQPKEKPKENSPAAKPMVPEAKKQQPKPAEAPKSPDGGKDDSKPKKVVEMQQKPIQPAEKKQEEVKIEMMMMPKSDDKKSTSSVMQGSTKEKSSADDIKESNNKDEDHHHHHHHEEDKNVNYKFEYAVNNKKTHDVKHHKEERKGDVVQGEYSLLEEDGNVRTVKYVADWKHGFRAQVMNSKKGRSRFPRQG